MINGKCKYLGYKRENRKKINQADTAVSRVLCESEDIICCKGEGLLHHGRNIYLCRVSINAYVPTLKVILD